MMMSDNKKKLSTLIIGKMKGPNHSDNLKFGAEKEKPMSEGGEVDNSIGIDSASEEVMHAIEKKDVKALTSALKSFMDMCYDEEQGESKDEEAAEPQEP